MNQGELRRYVKEFKLNAVKLYHSSGKTLCQLSKELGVVSRKATVCPSLG